MKYIFTVYKYKSFSKAAEALYMTQPALSIAVQKVEKRLGMPLFDRTCKPLKLTEAGALYIQKIQQIRNLEYELEQQLNDLSNLHTGSLRVGGSHYFNSYVLPPILTEFVQKYPGIHLELVEAGSDELLRMLYDQAIDLTFNCTLRPTDSFLRIPCFTDTILLSVPAHLPVNQRLSSCALTADDILNKKYKRSDVPSVSLADFSDTPFILLTPGNNLYERSRILFEEGGITPNVCLEVSQLVTAWHLSLSGMGASLISDLLVTERSHSILFYKVDSPLCTRTFDLTMSDRHYVSSAMSAFGNLFRSWYRLHSPEQHSDSSSGPVFPEYWRNKQ